MPADQTQTPFFDAVVRYAEKRIIPFHTPGHKEGKGVDPRFRDFLGWNPFRIDLSELDAVELGHNPEAVLHQAQKLAAEAFGADYTFFLVNGTTSGIETMITAVCRPGDKVILPRNVHRSIIGGLILSGAIPIYIEPDVDLNLGIAMGVSVEKFERALKRHPDARAVLIINPNYYGVAWDIKRIVDLVHSYGKIVLVDEAHGPHLRFHPALPMDAMAAGADMAAQSTHKILGSMTQSSMLHVRAQRVRIARVKTMLRIIQSTSPSYLLFSSLDVARMQMATQGLEILERTMALADEARERINKIPGLYSFGREIIGKNGVFGLDPTKVTVSVKGLGLTGMMAENILRGQYGVQVELSDLFNVLFIISLGDTSEDIERLVQGLSDLARQQAGTAEKIHGLVDIAYRRRPPGLPRQRMSPREAVFARTRAVPFVHSAGRISAEILAPYPPGIPVICPGEEISKEIIEYLRLVKKAGIHIQGPEDIRLERVRVVDV